MGLELREIDLDDLVEVPSGISLHFRIRREQGAPLVGLAGWASPKDVILRVCALLTVKGGTNRVVEYFGPGTRSLSCTGKATITNMGAELGATTSIFPFDGRMAAYLRATRRGELADLAEANRDLLIADPEVTESPEAHYDHLVEIDLSRLELQNG